MAESEPFYHQVMRLELEKPTDLKELLTLRELDNEMIIGMMDKLCKPLKTSEQSHGMMDKPMKPSGVQPEGEKSIPGETENSHIKAILEKATPGPVRPEESQLEHMKRHSTRIHQSSM